ncbi:MAG: DNA internalization-related competence protein ComEC/Rec2 [Rubrivivax sp.]|nr:DNA internalization-related competence protein ComEC/Rec2 [Rubrivivax sp.]
MGARGPRPHRPAAQDGIALAALLAPAWIAGSALQLQQPALWQSGAYGALAAAALVAAGLALYGLRGASATPARATVTVLLAAAIAALAFAATGSRALLRQADALPPALEDADLVLVGRVASLPRIGLVGARFEFAVESATLAGEAVTVPPRVWLGWWRGVDDDALLGGPAADLRAGQRWRLPVRLRQPHGALNPHGFDLELWLWEQGLRASGSVRSRPGAWAERLDEGAGHHVVERLRQDLRDAVFLRVADPAAAGVLAALAVGDQAAIERGDWDVFRATGVAHLMSISGLHVTMFAWLAAAVIGRLWRLSPRALLWRPAPLAARWGGLVLAAAYALLAGWGVPAQRTVAMIAVVVLLRSLGWRWPSALVLLAAALAVTLLDPWALLQPGFWLSFVAVALLFGSEPVASGFVRAEGWRARAIAALRGGLRTQAIATVGLAPLTLLFFQQVSLVGFVANLVAIPLVTLLVTPLALAGMLLPALWLPAAWLVQGLGTFLQTLAGWPGAVWFAAAAPAWAVASGLLGGVLAVLPLPWRLRALALPLLLPLLAPPVERPAPGQFELLAADVGQGTAVLVRTQRHLLLYDAGPRYSPEADAGGRVLLPLLRALGERHIDHLVLSHRDSDHVGGAATLLQGMRVREISSSLEPGHPLRDAAPHRACAAGQSWTWDGVHFRVLHPDGGETDPRARPNTLSCVLHIQGSQGSALLTGDLEAAQELRLVQRDPDALRSTLLLVPHHGSRTSSTGALLDAVQPRWAVVQAAHRSRFGHPAPEVLARYAARGITVHRSDRCGALRWRSDGPVVCERIAARRYWHHPGEVRGGDRPRDGPR